MPICKKRPIFRIPYFRPSKCRPCTAACMLPLSPPSRSHCRAAMLVRYIICRNSVCMCPSVCPSVCSVCPFVCVTRVLCDKTKQCTADILIPHERTITVVFWGDAPSVSNLRSKRVDFDRFLLITCENSSVMTNTTLTSGFPTSYIDGVHAKSPRSGSKKIFSPFLNKIIQLKLNKSS